MEDSELSRRQTASSDEPVIPPGCVLDEKAFQALKGQHIGLNGEDEKPESYRTAYGGSLNLPWFTDLHLTIEHQKLLCFSESCTIVTEGTETVGKMFIKVEQSAWDGKECMLVHSSSFAKLSDNSEVGTSLTGFITSKLHVIQEFAHEWGKTKTESFDRKTLLSGNEKKDGFLHIHSTFTKDKVKKSDDNSVIANTELSSFVSEAANIILLRLMMQQKKVGEVPLKTLTSNGKLTKVDYRILGNGFEDVKGENTQVWGIKRSVWEENNVISWDSLFNFYGRMVLRCQPESDHAMVPLWFRPIDDYNEIGEYIGMRPSILWACHPELHSKYKIKRTELKAQYKTYLADNAGLRALLSDFMQKLLLVKPKNVIDFSRTFFQPFMTARTEFPGGEADAKSSSSNEEYEDEYEGEFFDEYLEWHGEGDRIDVIFAKGQLGPYGSNSKAMVEPASTGSMDSYSDEGDEDGISEKSVKDTSEPGETSGK